MDIIIKYIFLTDGNLSSRVSSKIVYTQIFQGHRNMKIYLEQK